MQLARRQLLLLLSVCALVVGGFFAPAAQAAPTCQDITTSTAYETEKVIPVDCTGNAPTDPVTVAQDPFLGTATVEDNELHYTPFPGEIGQDQFTYVVTSPSTGASTPRTITVNIIEPAPVCQDVGTTTDIDTPVTLQVDCSYNDFSDPVTIVDGPSHGTAQVVNNELVYTPATGYSGNDSFTYSVTNDGGASVKRTASVATLRPAPVCTAVSANTAFETAVSFATDCTGDDPSDTITIEDAAANGYAIVENGQLKYTPFQGYDGTDTFTYTVTSNGGTSAAATATVTVAPSKPICQPRTAIVGVGKSTPVALSCTSTIPQTYELVGQPTHGTLSGFDGSTGAVTYTAGATFAGTDTFTYRATNTSGAATTVAVSVDVRAAPTIAVAVPAPSVAFGTKLSATATVNGRLAPGSGATTVDLRLYGPGDGACTGTPVFEKAAISYPEAGGAVSSGEFTPVVAGVYRWRAQYSGDPANVGALTACGVAQVEVAAEVIVPPVTGSNGGGSGGSGGSGGGATTVPTPEPTPTVCTGGIAVLNVVAAGKGARVTGIAPRALAGSAVEITRAGKSVGSGKVAEDGTFSVKVTGKPKSTASYKAQIAKLASPAYKYDTGLRVVSRDGSKVTAQFKLPAKSLPKKADVQRIDTCTGEAGDATSVTVSKTGRFTATLAAPNATEPYALYRVTAKVGGKTKTFSLQFAVTR